MRTRAAATLRPALLTGARRRRAGSVSINTLPSATQALE